MKLKENRRRFGLVKSLPGGFLDSSRPIRTTVSNRRGYTLLELLLASVAAAMLLSALYYSFDMTIKQTQVARDQASVEDLTRGVINRLSIDMSAVLGPLPPSSGGTSSVQASYTNAQIAAGATGSSSGSSTTGSSSSGSGMSGSSASGSGGSSMNSSNTPLLESGLDIPFEAGVIGGYEGQTTMLILFTSRPPDVFTSSGANSLAQMYTQGGTTSSDLQIPADLRRVVYWLGSSGGLYRQETPWVTGYNSGVSIWALEDLPLSDDPNSLVAQEVENVLFEFFDPYEQTWEQSWDGTGGYQPPFLMTVGPPPAIRVTLTFKFENPKGGSPIHSTIVQVFPIYTATGQITQTLYDPTSAGGSSSSSSSSSSSQSSTSK